MFKVGVTGGGAVFTKVCLCMGGGRGDGGVTFWCYSRGGNGFGFTPLVLDKVGDMVEVGGRRGLVFIGVIECLFSMVWWVRVFAYISLGW